MHLLYIHQYFCPPGSSGNNRSFELALEWAKAGHEITILTSTAYFPESLRFKEARKDFNFSGIKVIALNVEYSHMMGFRQRILAFIKFYRRASKTAKQIPIPDLIYASSTPPSIGELGRKLSKRWKIPFVFETVDVWPDVPDGMNILQNKTLLKWLYRRTNLIYNEASLIVTLSDGMRDQVCSHLELKQQDKVVVRYNGTNPDAFPFVEREAKPNVCEVIYTGTVGKANGISALLRLCKDVEQLGRNDIRFKILGGGNELESAKQEALQLNLSQIEFVSTVPKEEVTAMLAKASIGVVTFAPFKVLEANSANKFYDYLASGLPVLLNYEGWQAEYLKDFNAGLGTKMGDQQAFLQNLLKLVDSPQLRTEMGKNGRELALKHFDRRQIAAKLMKDFEKVLEDSN